MKRILLGSLLLLACALAFLPGIGGPFILDDEMNLLRARAPSGQIADIVDVLFRNDTGLLRRPVSNASFLVNYHWIGNTSLHYKAVNLLIHLVNGLLVWALASRLALLFDRELGAVTARRIGLLSAAVWFVHPIQVSTVLYAVQRMTQLSALFVFAAMLAALAALRHLDATANSRAVLMRAVGVGALAGLAVLSKENGALFPLLFAVTLLCATPTLRAQWWQAQPTRRFLWLTIAAPLALGAIALVALMPRILASYEIRDFTLVERLLTQPVVLAHYLYSILSADITAMGLFLDDFAIRRSGDPVAWLGLAACVALPLAAFRIRDRAPVLAFAILWFLAAHAMESTFIALEMAFEHRNHVAMLGPVFAAVYYAHRALSRLEGRQLALLAAIPLLLLAGLTMRRAHYWSNNDLFAIQEHQNHPKSTRAITQMAARSVARGELDAAVEHIRRAQSERPDSFWLKAYEIHLACVGAPVAIDWDGLLAQASSRPNELGLEEVLRPVARLYAQDACKGVDIRRFDAFLVDMIRTLGDTKRPRIIERLHILRHTLAEAMDAPDANDLLRAAIAANPEGLEALELLAYGELNAGRLDEAESLAVEFEQRIRDHHRVTILYKVDELREFIQQERMIQAGGDTPTNAAQQDRTEP